MVSENIYLFQADYSILDSVSDKSTFNDRKMDDDIISKYSQTYFPYAKSSSTLIY